MHGICEDSRIKVLEEELIFFEMKSILNLLIVKDILPPFLPIKNIRTFTDICKYFIFPFMLTLPENKTLDGGDSTPVNNGSSTVNSPIYADSAALTPGNPSN